MKLTDEQGNVYEVVPGMVIHPPGDLIVRPVPLLTAERDKITIYFAKRGEHMGVATAERLAALTALLYGAPTDG